LVSIDGISLQRFPDCSIEPLWQILSRRRHRRWRFREAFGETFFPCERGPASQHLEQHAPQTVRVAASIYVPVAHQLLGTHVRWSSGCAHSRARELTHTRNVDHAGDTEIGNDRMPAGKKNILGLYVAVYDPLRVRVGKCVCRLPRDGAGRIDRHLTLAVHAVAQRFAADVWHHVIEKCFDVSRIVERENVGMLQTRECADLAYEANLTRVGCRIRIEDFERDVALVPEIAREVHCREGALTDLAFDVVPSAERGAQ
jgi:hypothetical protein